MMGWRTVTKTRKDRERRKEVRRCRRETKQKGIIPRVRRALRGKSRSGEVAELQIEFSGRVVAIDPEQPEALGERDALAQAWEKQGWPTRSYDDRRDHERD